MANKTLVRVRAWEHKGDTFMVHYFTWDGKCLCTSQQHAESIKADFTDSPETVKKREIHAQVMLQLYDN